MTLFEVAVTWWIPIGLIAFGVFLLWIAAARRPPLSPSEASVLRVAGGALFVVGLMMGVFTTTWACAVITIPVVVLILIAAARRYYEAEQKSLLWLLVAAAERGIPLDQAARAFAAERNDLTGSRATHLAEYLEAGIPLGLALRRSGHRIDVRTSLAADLGYQTGTLGTALRNIVERDDAVETVTLPMAGRIIYLGIVVVQTLLVQSFVTFRILPVIQRVNSDFGVHLPQATQNLVASSEMGSGASFVWLAMVAMGLLTLLVGGSWFIGFPLRRIPLVRRLWWRLDSSLVMRWLASGVRQQRPVLDMLRLLASYFPQASMQRGLVKSARRVEQGSHWCDSLLHAGVIGRSESAVLKAAERAGNLPWALEEMADSATRRWAYRLQVSMNLAFPLILISLSGGVLAVILGIFMPLVSLIQGLS